MTMTSQSKLFVATLVALAACARTTTSSVATIPVPGPLVGTAPSVTPPSPDPRVGLRGGLMDAAEAVWNLRVLSKTPPPPNFLGVTNSDLTFLGNYAIQGSYNGYQVWDISNPARPVLKTAYVCPASQSDVSVYKNLLFVSSESNSGRLDCGTQGVKDTVSHERIRGVRIFDITDIANPKYLANVQTCRGSHTHSLLVDPKDKDNVYVYISGSASVRSASELSGCVSAYPENDPNSAHFRIEVIKVPLAHPEQAAIVSSPRIFNDLAPPPTHGEAAEDIAAMAAAKKAGAYTATIGTQEFILSPNFVNPMLDSVVKARNGAGAATGADSAALRAALPGIITKMFGGGGPSKGPDQCHDITLYPAIGRAGGACGGYGLLLDITDPAHPVRLGAVADSNFSYWHSASFNNDGTKLLFSDEWGGGGAPKCRATDKHEWGADAIFTLENDRMTFKSYYKMPAPQTSLENCVAHNGSLIPIPGRDVMVQAWYQGGISVFDWSDAAHPVEIAFHDRGPVDPNKFAMGGSWSVYWYNGVMVSSEIARGLDIFELTPSQAISQNEIDASKTVHLDYLNVQGQPRFVWPPSFALARSYLDQLERSKGLEAGRISAARAALASAERNSGEDRREALTKLAARVNGDASGAVDRGRVLTLARAISDLASAQR
jgi:LVIVD repeat